MTKSAKKRSTGKSAASSRKRLNPKKVETRAPIGLRSGTKQSAAIEMLRSRDGASIETLTKATGWQQHSVRGFLAGVVRKRLKLDLESTVVDWYSHLSDQGWACRRLHEARANGQNPERHAAGQDCGRGTRPSFLNAEIARLRGLDIKALRARWRMGFGETPRPTFPAMSCLP